MLLHMAHFYVRILSPCKLPFERRWAGRKFYYGKKEPKNGLLWWSWRRNPESENRRSTISKTVRCSLELQRGYHWVSGKIHSEKSSRGYTNSFCICSVSSIRL